MFGSTFINVYFFNHQADPLCHPSDLAKLDKSELKYSQNARLLVCLMFSWTQSRRLKDENEAQQQEERESESLPSPLSSTQFSFNSVLKRLLKENWCPALYFQHLLPPQVSILLSSFLSLCSKHLRSSLHLIFKLFFLCNTNLFHHLMSFSFSKLWFNESSCKHVAEMVISGLARAKSDQTVSASHWILSNYAQSDYSLTVERSTARKHQFQPKTHTYSRHVNFISFLAPLATSL